VAIISIVHRFDLETASPPFSDADTAQKTHPRACRAGSSGPITNGQTTLRVCSPALAAAPLDRFTGPLLWRQTKPSLSGPPEEEEEEARIRRQNLNGTGTTEYGRNETWRAKYNGWSGKGRGNERDGRVGARK